MNPTELLSALHTAERLKDTTRHCCTSRRRPESVAGHSWRQKASSSMSMGWPMWMSWLAVSRRPSSSISSSSYSFSPGRRPV